MTHLRIHLYNDHATWSLSLMHSLVAGHGTGVVKKVVQDHLKKCTYAGAYGAASFEQGGDALTVVAVK